MWMVLSDGRTFLPTNSKITMSVDSGASKHFVDDEQVLELKEKMLNYTVLNMLKKYERPGSRHSWVPPNILFGFITDKAGDKHEVGFPSMVVSSLGRYLFSSSDTATIAIPKVIAPGNPHLKRNNIVEPLHQLREDMRLCSF